jgi:hypothetical protein
MLINAGRFIYSFLPLRGKSGKKRRLCRPQMQIEYFNSGV